MLEQDRFEARLRTALRQYTADATSDLDPVAFAHRLATQTPRGRRAWPSLRGSAPLLGYLAWALLLAAILAITIGVVGAINRPHPPGLGSAGRIAFDTGGHVILSDATATGTGQHDLSPAAGGDYLPIWSPDGTKLAFWREAGAFFSIVVTDPDGRVIRAIPTQQPTGDPHGTGYAGGAGGPLAWSPDSQRLVCWMWTGPFDQPFPRLFIVPTDGSVPRQVGDPTIPAVDPSWSPDGGRIVFAGVGEWFKAAGAAPDSSGVFVMRSDGTDVHRVSRSPSALMPESIPAFRQPQWQPGGDLIAYQANPNGLVFHVFVVHADGTGERDVSREVGIDAIDEDQWPTWSPDGRRLAFPRFVSQLHGYRVVIVDSDGTNGRILPALAVDSQLLTWSPDGTRVLANVSNPATGGQRVVVEIDIAHERATRSFAVAFDQQAGWQWLPP